jgi:radical SAM family uncharacterized protein/radical SAM-linked protein
MTDLPTVFDHPYAALLPRVDKPTRYTGSEYGARRKDWSRVEARICLAFPDIYDIGMSHLGYRILYRILNDDPRTLAERAYTPWVDMQRELRQSGHLLLSLESARPLSDFDVVGFSLQYELTYTNVLTMLDLGGVPLRSKNRSEDDPLVIAGGPVATHAEPIAPFIDAFVIGDGEESAREVALAWVRGRKAGRSRDDRLRELAARPGVYVPSLYETRVEPETGLEVVTGSEHPDAPLPVRRSLVEDLSKYPFPDDGPVGGPEAIFERMSIEVARGCTEGCRFCQAGMIYRPVRERDPEEVVGTVLRAIEKSGQDEVSLTALSTADVSCISPMIKRLVEKTAPRRVSLGVASLRAYGLAEDLLDDMRRVRAAGLTFAPEAGTQRMRDVINKNVTEEQLLETAERTFSRGFDSMKLYFMIGLPTEDDEDVDGIADVGKNALAVGKRLRQGRAKVTVSVSTHVPKPHTPFQWCAMDSKDEVVRKQRRLADAVRGTRGLTLRTHDPSTSVLEGILARGDRRLADVVERVYLHGGRFDSWEDQLRLDLWREAFDHFDIDVSRYLGTLPVTAHLPWSHIDVGLEPGFLAREYRRALKNRLSPPCGKAKGMFIHHTNVADADADARKLICYDCGVACDLTAMREERITFLRKMGAETPGERARLPVVSTGPPARGPEAYRVPQTGTPVRVRLQFSKTGPLALLGHLDLIRELPRVVRRAGLVQWYTQGFHPKPEMTFSPALSLGLASLAEVLDLVLIDPPGEAEILDRLDRACCEGLRFTGARRLGPHDPKLSTLIDQAEYVIGLPVAAVQEIGGRAALEERLAAFHAAERVEVRRSLKGIGKIVDVKRFVCSLVPGGEPARAALDAAGIGGGLVTLAATTSITPGGSVKASEIVEAVLGEHTFPFVAVRTALRGNAASPLDLEAHRRSPKTAPQDEAPAASV